MSVRVRRKVKFSKGERESRESSCRRFHISDARLQALLDDGTLWYAVNPRNGISEVVGHRTSYPTDDSRGFLANLAWAAVWWILLFLLALPFSGLQLARAVFCATGLLGLVIWWSKVHPAPDVVYDGNVVRVPIKMGLGESYASGGDLFDEVSTRRREDLQYLLGIGKYSKEKW